MTFGKYFTRWIKYLVKMALLIALLLFFMILSETSTLTFDNFAAEFFGSLKGQLFMAVVFVWSLFYPATEYISRHMGYDMAAERGAIVKAFDRGGMALAEDTGGRMVFRSESRLKRLLRLGEDAVTVTPGPTGGFTVEGPRRWVGDAVQRIPGYVEMEKIEKEN